MSLPVQNSSAWQLNRGSSQSLSTRQDFFKHILWREEKKKVITINRVMYGAGKKYLLEFVCRKNWLNFFGGYSIYFEKNILIFFLNICITI